MPKVLLINGSPHARGCTWVALNELQQTLERVINEGSGGLICIIL